MASVTAWLAGLATLSGAVTFFLGVRVGHGASPLADHLLWGTATLLLQVLAALVAAVHARAGGRQVALLRAALEEATAARREPGSPEG